MEFYIFFLYLYKGIIIGQNLYDPIPKVPSLTSKKKDQSIYWKLEIIFNINKKKNITCVFRKE